MSYPTGQPGGSFRSHTAVVYGPGASSVVAGEAAVVSDEAAGRGAGVTGVVVAGSRAVVAGSPYKPPGAVVGAAVVGSAATLTVRRVVAVAEVAAVAVPELPDDGDALLCLAAFGDDARELLLPLLLPLPLPLLLFFGSNV